MNAAVPSDSERLAHMAGEVTALQAIGEAWPLEQRAVLDHLKDAIEALHREALLRLVKGLRAEPAAAAQLKEIVRDPFVFGVLRLHGIVRDPLEARVRAALESVAPMLAEHNGGVELVSVQPPDTVEVRLTGSCQSCPSSGQTLSEGVERAIKEHAPEDRARAAGQAPGRHARAGRGGADALRQPVRKSQRPRLRRSVRAGRSADRPGGGAQDQGPGRAAAP